jgi:hypothetical protein
VINNVNKYYPTIKNIDVHQIPEITNPILDVYAKNVNCAFKPKDMDLCLRSRVKDLNQLTSELQSAKKWSTFKKIGTLCLMALNLALCAAAIFLAPTTGMILNSIFFSLLPLHGIYKVFTEVKKLEKTINSELEPLNERIEMLKKLLENHSLIRQGIIDELKQIDLTKIETKDIVRIEQLTNALGELDKAVALFDQLNASAAPQV